MATQSDTRTLIRQAISQPDAGNSDFADAELNGFIDQGVRYLGALVKKPIKRTNWQAALDTSGYAIATVAPDLVLCTKAYFGNVATIGDVQPLRIITEEELAELSPSWLDATASSQGRPNYLVRDGANLMIVPRPNALESVLGKLVYLSYVYQPAASSNLVTLDLPILYHDLVKDYAVHLCYMGKLNNKDLGLTIKAQVQTDAKKLETLIIKDSESTGFSWGGTIDPEDYSAVNLVP